MKTCSLIEHDVQCVGRVKAGGLCAKHYRRKLRYGSPFALRREKPKSRIGPDGIEWQCFICKEFKLPVEFPVLAQRERHSYCILCNTDYRRETRLARIERDPERENLKVFSDRLMRQFNISVEQYLQMEAAQGGLCGIRGVECEAKRNGSRLAVDHDRRCCPGRKSCGKCVRGLLCTVCNTRLGTFELTIESGMDQMFVGWRDRRPLWVSH